MAKNSKNQVAVSNRRQLSSNVPTAGNYDYDSKVLALTVEEKEKCENLTQNLNITDISTIGVYGRELSDVISRNGDQLISAVSSTNTSEAVEMTKDLLKQLKLVDIDELNDTSKIKQIVRQIPILRRFVSSVSDIFDKYDTIESRVNKIQDKFVQAKQVAQRDNATLEQIFDNNVTYINDLRDLIVAAKYKRAELVEELERMKRDPEIENYQINDANMFINSLDKRIADMITEEVSLEQDLYKIRMTQYGNVGIADRADNIVMHVVPMWKGQIALSVIMQNQKAGKEAETLMYDYTQQILQRNAELAHQNTIDIARESERPMISIETMNKVTQEVVATLNEMQKIRDEGARNREAHLKACEHYAAEINAAIQAKR